MKKYQVITKRSSTVCGYPGRGFDWSKFDWEGKSIHKAIFKLYAIDVMRGRLHNG